MKEEKLIEQKPHEQLSRAARLFIFIIFIALSIVMSGDNGVQTTKKKQVRRDLQLDEKGYGFFGVILSLSTPACLIRSIISSWRSDLYISSFVFFFSSISFFI